MQHRFDTEQRELTATGQELRPVVQIVRGQTTSDGDGVRLKRVMGSRVLPDLDPFLMLDEFRSDSAGDYIGGFPSHPHRGFETVSYMLAGKMRHQDNKGNSGLLEAGSVQWMTAGRGIIHSEMPEQENGLLWGFQLWVNLPAAEKLREPRYQDIPPQAVPEVVLEDGILARILAGRANDVAGPVQGISVSPIYLDIALGKGKTLDALLPETHTAFLYVYEGAMTVGDESVNAGELAVFGSGNRIEASAGDQPTRFILVAGRPLHEPIAKYGPFVMNTQAELQQAFADYHAGKF